MGMVIANNISALNTTRQLNKNNLSLRSSLEKLSSGYRINTGKDAPADLIISEQLRAQNTGLKRAVRNTNEAMNVLGIAEGALNEMNSILKKMRELALHAANNGITSPSQVAADQSEMDSGIQTIDRIAQTTRYSDQFLLNGGKEILFDRTVKEGDNAMLDLGFSRIDQVFKTGDINEVMSYTGEVVAGDAAVMTTQATKGFMEAGATTDSRLEIDATDNTLVNDQRFVITGKNGSREFSFSAGSSLKSIADAINNVSDSLGVEATLTLASMGVTSRTNDTDAAAHISGQGGGNDAPAASDIMSLQQTLVFDNDSATDRTDGITWYNDPLLGKHTDGHGRIYVEYSDGAAGNLTAKLYKAAADPDTNEYDENDLVAQGSVDNSGGAVTTLTVTERNNSGLAGQLQLTTSAANTQPTDVILLTHSYDRTQAAHEASLDLAGNENNWGVRFEAVAALAGEEGNKIGVEFVDPGAPSSTLSTSITGDSTKGYKISVTLGTDADGDINSDAAAVIASITATEATFGTDLVDMTDTSDGGTPDFVDARSLAFLSGGIDANRGANIDGDMSAVDNLAFSGISIGENTDADGKLYVDVQAQDIFVYKDSAMAAADLVAQYDSGANFVDDNTYLIGEANDSGLRMALEDAAVATSLAVGTSTITFEMGLRLSSTGYGDENFVRVQAIEGSMWDAYDPTDSNADVHGYANMDTSSGFVTKESRGTNATLSVNGLDLRTTGLTANAATPDFNGELVFQQGEVGKTTLARVGQDKGYSTTAIGQMTRITNMAVNAGVNNEETLSNFKNGMQFQLGEGAGDQERTVYGIQAMTISNLGKVAFTDDFEGSGTQETKTLTMSDMLGGGYASLAVDPIKALSIIDEAIDDVSSLRARIGAFQANLLQTNSNNLGVAIENITATESAIRDADMAYETTEFTKNQIMVSAATSMLAQANVAQQGVLQLLQ